uniref:Uncharacterized protein n=1 Tax=Quercus lobata TaxID=97700 RepID=A0A7N2LA88_QUELO
MQVVLLGTAWAVEVCYARLARNVGSEYMEYMIRAEQSSLKERIITRMTWTEVLVWEMGDDFNYYKDSMTIVSKGVELELVKILIIFTAIDLSNNRFYAEIPDSVGNLKALIVLNLSSNNFIGHIPSSLGNLIELEFLDLSQNSLVDEIPRQLTSLTFLEYLKNLSQNQLIGPIPQGEQFSTFQSFSFEGNLGLCGFQLSKKCGNNEIPTSEMRHESSLGEGFCWKVVVIGYTCGLAIGLVTGHAIITRTHWLV